MLQLRAYTLCFFVAISLLPANSWSVPAEGHKMMAAGPTPVAIEVARKVILNGGNVVDVAVAMGMTLAVTTPYFASLGGGGFAMVKMGKYPVEVLDFREMAPGKTHPKFYLDKPKDASRVGPHAVGVPGVPAGLWALHKKYGKLQWSYLLDEPIKLAKKGFRVSGEWSNRTRRVEKNFSAGAFQHFFREPNRLDRSLPKVWQVSSNPLRKGRSVYKPGELLKQKGLAKALQLIRNRGITPFYQGVIGRDIVKTLQGLGGVMTMEDMRNYKVRWLKPLTTEFADHKLYLMPPPSSGGIVLKGAFTLAEQLKLKDQPLLSANELHLLGEIFKVTFRGRMLLGDPDFHKNPIEQLTSKKEMKKYADRIRLDRTIDLEPVEVVQFDSSKNTTHFSVLDRYGNAVALTVTLNTIYGSKVVSNKYGIALNNEMDDFTTRPGEPNFFGLVQGKANYVEAGKRPLSSMSPTLVEKDGQIVMAIGAQGGSKIITGVYQSIYRSLVNGLNMDRAIKTPRVHHQFLPKVLDVEHNRISPEVQAALKEKGHKLRIGPWEAKAYGVKLNKEGILEAANDDRNEGASGGI